MSDALPAACVQCLGYDMSRKHDHRQVGHAGQIEDASVGLEILHLILFRVDGIDVTSNPKFRTESRRLVPLK